MTTLLQLLRWVLAKFLIVGLLVAGGVGGYGLWLFLHDTGDFEVRRNEVTASLAGKQRETRAALDDVRKRRDDTAAEVTAQEARASQADKVIATLHDLESTWDRFIGNPAQQKANAEQIQRMEEMRDAARVKAAGLKQEVTRLIWERDGIELTLGKIDAEMTYVQEHNSAAGYYLRQSWQTTRWAVVAVLVLNFFRLLMFAPRPRREE